ncbi:hypothetical protein HanIR_Chr15g0746931 [Helianthus annuus]|nr:hypothetical protein HanIR_Chr15g0746931 [Helianthus annuus]
MKERGKSVESETEYTNFYQDYNFYNSSSSNIPCKKHPSSSPVGICAYCLKDRLMKLVCSDCGEQRLSSCSCSDVSSYRNSSCTVDVGSVGRISFLIENDDQRSLFDFKKQSKKETEDVLMFKRSNSCVVEVKKSHGFWRIGKLFKKRREKEECRERNSEIWVNDCGMDVSRSRSLCSFRGGGFDHEGGSVSDMAFSSAKISDFNESEPRKSGFRGHSKVWKWIFKQHSGKKDLNHILES